MYVAVRSHCNAMSEPIGHLTGGLDGRCLDNHMPPLVLEACTLYSKGHNWTLGLISRRQHSTIADRPEPVIGGTVRINDDLLYSVPGCRFPVLGVLDSTSLTL